MADEVGKICREEKPNSAKIAGLKCGSGEVAARDHYAESDKKCCREN